MLAVTKLTSLTPKNSKCFNTNCYFFQLSQAKAGKLNPHVHVEYEWNLRQEEIDESDDDLDDKVSMNYLHGFAQKPSKFLFCGNGWKLETYLNLFFSYRFFFWGQKAIFEACIKGCWSAFWIHSVSLVMMDLSFSSFALTRHTM